MDLARMPGVGIGRDISRGEMAEKGLDAFIEQRHAQRVWDEGERAIEDAWAESSRRVEARQKAETDRSRLEWHRSLESLYAARSREHGERANELDEETKQKGNAA